MHARGLNPSMHLHNFLAGDDPCTRRGWWVLLSILLCGDDFCFLHQKGVSVAFSHMHINFFFFWLVSAFTSSLRGGMIHASKRWEGVVCAFQHCTFPMGDPEWGRIFLQ